MPDASSAPAAAAKESRFAILALSGVHASNTNPRKHFDQRLVDELAESIRTHGVAQPILVRPSDAGFEIVAGERRWRAVTQLGLDTIPAMVRDLSDLEALEIQVIENLQRADLHELEEAEGYEQLMKAHAFTADQVAEKIGKSRAYVYGRLKLIALCPAARKAFYDGELNASTALMVARIPHEKQQQEAIEHLGDAEGGAMSVRRARDYVQKTFMLRLAEAPFSKKDPQLVPAAGPCTTCPKRTGNQPELFADVQGADVCTDPLCFANKLQAFHDRATEKVKATGARVIEGEEAAEIFPYRDTLSYVRGGFVAATAQNWSDSKQRKNDAIAKDAGIEPVFARAPGGELVKVFEEKKINAAIKAANPRRDEADSLKAAKQKAKVENEYRSRVFAAVSSAAVDRLTTHDWHFIAARVVDRLWHEHKRRLVTFLGWDKDLVNDAKRMTAAIEAMPDGALAILMLQVALLGDLGVNEYNSSAKAEYLETVAERHGVEHAAIKKSVAAEFAMKKSAKKAPADVKYHNSETGETWSGGGRAPKWIEGKDRAPFKVQPAITE